LAGWGTPTYLGAAGGCGRRDEQQDEERQEPGHGFSARVLAWAAAARARLQWGFGASEERTGGWKRRECEGGGERSQEVAERGWTGGIRRGGTGKLGEDAKRRGRLGFFSGKARPRLGMGDLDLENKLLPFAHAWDGVMDGLVRAAALRRTVAFWRTGEGAVYRRADLTRKKGRSIDVSP